jgi:hypothetical protein
MYITKPRRQAAQHRRNEKMKPIETYFDIMPRPMDAHLNPGKSYDQRKAERDDVRERYLQQELGKLRFDTEEKAQQRIEAEIDSGRFEEGELMIAEGADLYLEDLNHDQ